MAPNPKLRRPGPPATAAPPYDEVTELDWDAFQHRWWQRRIVVVRGGAAARFALPDVFAAAVAASRRQLAGTYDAVARRAAQFSIDGEHQAFVAPWLPAAADRDFAGYTARLATALAGRRHALVISRFHGHAFPLWSRLRAELAPLWQRIGLPISSAITTLFHGDYEATPTGVHKDRFATMLFALAGRKRMRFWPERPWTEPVSTITDYAAHLASSFAIELDPGDLLYWPSSYYHVGESPGGIATSLHIGIPTDEQTAAHAVADLLAGTLDDPDLPASARSISARSNSARSASARSNSARSISARSISARSISARSASAPPALVRSALTSSGRLPAQLPAALRGALADLQRLTAPAPAAALLRTRSLARRSAGGFSPAPPPARRLRLHNGDVICGDPASPILLAPATGPRNTHRRHGGWLLAANGTVIALASPSGRTRRGHPDLPALCAALNTGQPFRICDLLLDFGPHTADVRAALEQLLALRALVRNPRGSPCTPRSAPRAT